MTPNRHSPIPRSLTILGGLPFLIAGCLHASNESIHSDPVVDTAESPLRNETPSGTSIFDRPLTRLAVEFKVHRYTAPRGTFTGDAGIWKKINGPLPTAAMTMQLSDNGFRAAIGRESDRRLLVELLDELRMKVDLRNADDHAVPDANKLIELDLGRCDPRLALFYHEPEGALRGMDFESAKAKLLMSFEMRTGNLHEVTIKVVPALEEPPGPPRWVMTADGSAQQVPEERRHVFTDVVLTAQIPEGGFLLLGASDIVYDLPYLGRPFFLEQETPRTNPAGESPAWRESIYIISPVIRSWSERGSAQDTRSGLAGGGR